MKKDLSLKKILKEEIKQNLLQEEIEKKIKNKFLGYIGSMLAGLALGGMVTSNVKDPEPKTQTTNIARDIFLRNANTEQQIITELENLDREDLIAAIVIITERLEKAKTESQNLNQEQKALFNRLSTKLLSLLSNRRITAPALVRRLNRLQF